MTDTTWGVVLGLAVPALGIVGIIVGQRMARTARREMTPAEHIVALERRLANSETRQAATEARLETTENRLDASLRRERLRDDYIHELRDHISAGREPPPPPWPEGLTT